MKIVNKYELAMEPNGTPFYELDHGEIISGLQILDAFRSKHRDGTTFFNGVSYTYPDNDLGRGGHESFEYNMPDKYEWLNIDTDSNDYEDDDKFLVLSAEDFRIFIDQLENYYEQMTTKPVPDIEFDDNKPLFDINIKSPIERLYDDRKELGLNKEAMDAFMTDFCKAIGIPKQFMVDDKDEK